MKKHGQMHRRVLLLASYCGEDNPDCTASLPCQDCLAMCNVILVTDEEPEVLGGLEYLRECARANKGALLTTKNTDTHDLYRTGDKDAPDIIKDRNGHVVLELCRRCGRGEIELSAPCGELRARHE
jgi:hypothetical protein